jgi:hypothetical protein
MKPVNPNQKRVFIWRGAIGYNYKSQLVRIKTAMNSIIYFKDIIRKSEIKSELYELHGAHKWVLPQENTPPHVDKQTLLNSAAEEIDIIPDWPPKSQDLNKINSLINSTSMCLNKVLENNSVQIHNMNQPKIQSQEQIIVRIQRICN